MDSTTASYMTAGLAVRGIEGAGRLVLVVLPLFATALLGARSGYVATAMSLTLYAAVAVLHARGVSSPVPLVRKASYGPDFWLLQGAMLVLVQAQRGGGT